jgi:hypothetical protein
MEQPSKFQAYNQSQNRKADRDYDSTVCSLPSRQGNQIIGHAKSKTCTERSRSIGNLKSAQWGGKETNVETIVDEKYR